MFICDSVCFVHGNKEREQGQGMWGEAIVLRLASERTGLHWNYSHKTIWVAVYGTDAVDYSN